MGYLLLGIENLAASLLLVAFAIALVARLNRRGVRTSLAALIVALPLLGYACLTVLLYQIEFDRDAANMHWTLPLLLVTLACTAATMVLVRHGFFVPRVPGAPVSYWVWFALIVLAPTLFMLLWILFGSLDAGALQYYRFGWFWPFLMLTISFLLGALLLVWRGLRARPITEGDLDIDAPLDAPVARVWSPARLALAFAVALMLHVMTFSNLDATAKRNLSVVRAEASVLAQDVAPPKLPARDNAATYYFQAIDAMDREAMQSEKPSERWPLLWQSAIAGLPNEPFDRPVGFDFGSAEMGAFLKEHAGEIQLLRTGASLPDCYFDHDYGSSGWDTLIPEITDMRAATNLLLVHAHWAAATGDLKSAFADLAAVRTMARHITSEPFQVVMTFAAMIDRSAFASLQTILRNRTVSAEDLAAFQFEDLYSYRRALPRVLQSDEAMTLTMFADIDERIDLQYALALSGSTKPGPLMALFGLGPIYRVFMLVPDMGAYREFMQGVHELSILPYQRVQLRLKKLHADLTRKGAGPMAMAASDTEIFEIAFRGEAINNVARAAIAMHRFHAAQGRFPDSLAELTPDIIPVVPRDPYNEQPLKFQKTETGWVIYSVGPDLKNDGGQLLALKPVDGVPSGDIGFEFVKKQQ